ncbi:site-specific integrase [Bernardetia sp. Wsw4-3y2]|uniref:site-specific integrase n=1 Tax=Bernardetia sp. Wsw4-3y2 TaxID=3127471 RepID=UPI0030D4D2D4
MFQKNRFMNVVFSIRKDQKNTNGQAMIYWYLSNNGQRSRKYSTGIRVNYKFWERNHATGINAKPINDALDNLRADLTSKFNQYQDTISNIQEIADYHIKGFEKVTVIELFDFLIERKKTENWTKGTLKVYQSFRNVWLVPFCNSVGVPFYAENFRPLHLENLCTEMRKRCKEEFIRKSIGMVKAAFNLGFSLEKIKINYLKDYKLFHYSNTVKEYVYLDSDELERFAALTFTDKEQILERDRDLFLIQCYTSLAFSEISSLDFSNIEFDKDWNWINIRRGKTNTLQQIPLLPQPMAILEKYNFQLQVTANYRYNSNIRICAYRAKIDKHLHSHLGRTTSGAFFLNSGIDINVVSRVMGHKSYKMTEKHYAKIIDKWRVKNEFNKVFRSEQLQEQQKEKPNKNEPQKRVTTNFNFIYSYQK